MCVFTESTLIMGVPAARIAAVIEAVCGEKDRERYKLLLGIAQTIRDMTLCGRFGNNLERVLQLHFPKGREEYDRCCLEAVEDVFVKGILRCDDWRIYQLRFIDDLLQQTDEDALSSLLERHRFLGTDGVNARGRWLYFGKKRLYRVEVASYKLRSNAKRLCDYLRSGGMDCLILSGGGRYRVQVGAFYSKENAERYARTLAAKRFPGAFVTSGF